MKTNFQPAKHRTVLFEEALGDTGTILILIGDFRRMCQRGKYYELYIYFDSSKINVFVSFYVISPNHRHTEQRFV